MIIVHPVLNNLREAEYQGVKSLVRAIALVPGEELGPWTWFVASGAVAVSDDTGVDLLVVSTGGVVDLTSVPLELGAKLFARVEGLAYALNPETLWFCRKSFPELLEVVADRRAGSIASVVAAQRFARTSPPLARVARYLGWLPVAEVPFTCREIGAFTGLSMPQAYSQLTKLEDLRAIKKVKGHVHITDRAKLKVLGLSEGEPKDGYA